MARPLRASDGGLALVRSYVGEPGKAVAPVGDAGLLTSALDAFLRALGLLSSDFSTSHSTRPWSRWT